MKNGIQGGKFKPKPHNSSMRSAFLVWSLECEVWSFGRAEKVVLKNAFVPDCIIIDLIFFAVNRRVAPMCATYL